MMAKCLLQPLIGAATTANATAPVDRRMMLVMLGNGHGGKRKPHVDVRRRLCQHGQAQRQEAVCVVKVGAMQDAVGQLDQVPEVARRDATDVG